MASANTESIRDSLARYLQEEIGKRAVHGGLLRIVKPDLQHNSARKKLMRPVARSVDVSNDSWASQIGQ